MVRCSNKSDARYLAIVGVLKQFLRQHSPGSISNPGYPFGRHLPKPDTGPWCKEVPYQPPFGIPYLFLYSF